MPRVSTNYNFIEEVNSVITGTIDEDDYNTAVTTWLKDSWIDVISKINSENTNALQRYTILADGNLENVDTSGTFGSVALAEQAVGLDQIPSGIKSTIKNRNSDNLFVYYGDAEDLERAFVIIGSTLWHFIGNTANKAKTLRDAGRASLKYYGAAYAEPALSSQHTDSGDAVIEGYTIQ